MSGFRQLRTSAVEMGVGDRAVLIAGWFGRLPQPVQDRIVSRSRLRAFAKGEYLIRQGETGHGMYALLSGRTHHLCQISEAEDVLLHVGEPGLWVGEYPLLSDEVAVGSVVAAVASRTLFLPRQAFDAIIDEEPHYLRYFTRLLAHRFALAFRFVAESHGLSAEDWLLSRLRGILDVQRSGTRDEPPLETIAISQSQLANLVGLSRQTLNVLLNRLAKRGLIEIGFRSIRVRCGSAS